MKIKKLLFYFLFASSVLFAKEPVSVYLTIESNPATTMNVCWVISGTGTEQSLKYRQASSQEWFQIEAIPEKFPEKLPYMRYCVELSHLKPDTRYEFVLPDSSDSYAFRTFPEHLSRPVTFVVGGDIYHDEIETVERMNKVAARHSPDAALLGGDIAYSGSKFSFYREEGERWVQFLKTWYATMKRPDGTLIPMLTTIGNHDINGRYDQACSHAQFYYFLFPGQNEIGYEVIDFGDYLSLWLLNSGHSAPVGGAQASWLEKTLSERSKVPLKFALYHVPAFPSVRAFDSKRSVAVRETWVPLFEKYGLNVAFENHDHAYKRSHLIRNGVKSSDGILYMGDGAWGVDYPRPPRTPNQAWYLAASAQKRHVVLVTIEKDHIFFEAVSSDGEIFDEFRLYNRASSP